MLTASDRFSGRGFSGKDRFSGRKTPDDAILFTYHGNTDIVEYFFGDFDFIFPRSFAVASLIERLKLRPRYQHGSPPFKGFQPKECKLEMNRQYETDEELRFWFYKAL